MDGQRQKKAFAGGSCRTFPQSKKGAYTTQWYKRLHLNSMDYMPDTAAIKTRHGIPEVFTYKSKKKGGGAGAAEAAPANFVG